MTLHLTQVLVHPFPKHQVATVKKENNAVVLHLQRVKPELRVPKLLKLRGVRGKRVQETQNLRQDQGQWNIIYSNIPLFIPLVKMFKDTNSSCSMVKESRHVIGLARVMHTN
jgi:hypothetical protein